MTNLGLFCKSFNVIGHKTGKNTWIKIENNTFPISSLGGPVVKPFALDRKIVRSIPGQEFFFSMALKGLEQCKTISLYSPYFYL